MIPLGCWWRRLLRLVVDVSGATQIAAGQNHSCAVVAGGAMKCWGYNDIGQLGNGTTNNSNVPVRVLAG